LFKQINLLDSKRSLNINIYLKQFRCSPDEIVRLLSNNENHELGLENLEGMLKILPDANEVNKFLKIYYFLNE
jgi:inverted formin-2